MREITMTEPEKCDDLNLSLKNDNSGFEYIFYNVSYEAKLKIGKKEYLVIWQNGQDYYDNDCSLPINSFELSTDGGCDSIVADISGIVTKYTGGGWDSIAAEFNGTETNHINNKAVDTINDEYGTDFTINEIMKIWSLLKDNCPVFADLHSENIEDYDLTAVEPCAEYPAGGFIVSERDQAMIAKIKPQRKKQKENKIKTLEKILNGDEAIGNDLLWYLALDHNKYDLTRLDTSEITNIACLFVDEANFNQNISNWDVSNVTDMRRMFSGAESFNQNISKWDTRNVTNVDFMFYGADSFNQDISNWNTNNVDCKDLMFYKSSEFKVSNDRVLEVSQCC